MVTIWSITATVLSVTLVGLFISGRVDRASATETADSCLIPGRVKPKNINLVFTASLLDVQQLKGQYEASAVCGRQVLAA